MAYEPTSWKAGDVVTSAKLNKMENGIAGAGPLIVHKTVDPQDETMVVLDKTWQEIHDAEFALIIGEANGSEANGSIEISLITYISWEDGTYGISAGLNTLTCKTADGYPRGDGIT